MASIAGAESTLIENMLYYTNWDGDAGVPYTLTITTKREADPRRFVAIPTASFPAATVQIMQRQPAPPEGTQERIIYTVRMTLIRQFVADDEPTTDMRLFTSKVVENILQTKADLVSKDYLNLSWISLILFPTTSYDNDFERWLRGVNVAQAGSDALGFVSSQTDFQVWVWSS